jgi:hypothetical protein
MTDSFKHAWNEIENKDGAHPWYVQEAEIENGEPIWMPISGTHVPLKEFRKRLDKANTKTQTPQTKNEKPTLRVRIFLCAAFVHEEGSLRALANP